MSSTSTRRARRAQRARRTRRGTGTLVAVMACGGLLAGCSVAGTDFSPGVAAEVGDTQIKVEQIDTTVTGFCDYLADNPAPESAPQPRVGYRSDLVRILVERAVVEQLLEDYDVDAGSNYRSQVAEIEQTNGSLPDDQAEAKNLVETSLQLVQQGKFAIGQADLEADDGEPTVEEAAVRGDEVVAEWFTTHDVEINPEYGLTVESGVVGFVDDQLSVAVGDAATSTNVTEAPDPEYVAGLPSSQVCG